MIRRALFAVVVGATAMTGVTPSNAQHSTYTRTETYYMGEVGPVTHLIAPVGCGGGTVCFMGTTGEWFTVEVEDDSGRQVGGIAHLTDRYGVTVVSEPFCGSSGPLPAAPGDIRVHLDAPGDVRGAHWRSGPGCTEIAAPGSSSGVTTLGATRGRVHVTFIDRG